jgi:hypothetical protein
MSDRWTERSILCEVAKAAAAWHEQPKSADRRGDLGRWLAALTCWDGQRGAKVVPPLPLDPPADQTP